MFAVIVAVPVEIVNSVSREPVVPLRARDAPVKVPAPTFSVLAVLPVAFLAIVTAPLAVNDAVASASVIVEAPALVEKAIVVHCAAYPEGTVTVTNAPIVTESDDPGMEDPPHVAVLFQAPVTLAVLAAARVEEGKRTVRNKSEKPKAIKYFL